jgi:transcriptional antiterminator NusG
MLGDDTTSKDKNATEGTLLDAQALPLDGAAPVANEQQPSSDKLQKTLAAGDTHEFRWYVVHSLTGQENKVAQALKERIFNHKMEKFFSEVLVPEETLTTNKNGKKRAIKKKFFPGYILIKMMMNEQAWHLVRGTDKITDFLGVKGKPIPLSDDEAKSLVGQISAGFKKTKLSSSFSEGDIVKVVEGPFASFVGTVESVNEKGKIKVQVSIFGRMTPVELDFTQVEKVD